MHDDENDDDDDDDDDDNDFWAMDISLRYSHCGWWRLPVFGTFMLTICL